MKVRHIGLLEKSAKMARTDMYLFAKSSNGVKALIGIKAG